MRQALRVTYSAGILLFAVFSLTATALERDGVPTGVGGDSASTYLPTPSQTASYCVEVGGRLYCW